MIPRGSPYISAADLWAAIRYLIVPYDARRAAAGVEALWGEPDRTVAALSVRTGLDALLGALALPRGSEIVISAITIPHIVAILDHHGIIPVPVDIDLDTLAVDADDVRRAITSRARAILIAHLFGSRSDVGPVAHVAREHGVLLLEDCAQAYDGSGYRGHAASDVAMFRFGSIKRQTALGGALLRFRDADLALRVRDRLSAYPTMSLGAYGRRIATMAAIKAVASRAVFRLFVTWCRLAGRDHDRTLGLALRGFSHGELFARLRQRPPAAMLRLLERRLRQDARRAVASRVAVVDAVASEYPGLPRPGVRAEHHSHWLFPTLSADPETLTRRLWQAGFDATRGASNLTAVVPPADRPSVPNAQRLMREVVYLPLHPRGSRAQWRRLARHLREASTAS
jgi:perosamine synthetase